MNSNETVTPQALHFVENSKSKEPAIKVGISSCLLGQNVRFNGGHSRSNYCDDTLQNHFSFETFCPEMAAGFGAPRPTLRLEGDPNAPRLAYSNKPGSNVIDEFLAPSQLYVETLDHLDGYILMKKSPSCGLSRIKVYQENGNPHTKQRSGLFTELLQKKYPYLPIEEDARLNDPALRENFILRVYAHHEFRHCVDAKLSMHALLEFHSRYKYVVMSQSQPAYKALGKLLSENRSMSIIERRDCYFSTFMEALSKPAKRRNHCNTLMHLMGYLKRHVESSIRRDILNVIEQYRRGEVNLTTPMTLLQHYLKHYGSEYVKQQRYTSPYYPSELGIRNQI
ncbi:YbgA family protein [Marinomonas sp. 2405UD68-3]|uniref:YbgA family protein n=1 Tax=Marinomonas sp. 2405UD68-3 TaxID=3391835 RepID=UPI0039C9BF09